MKKLVKICKDLPFSQTDIPLGIVGVWLVLLWHYLHFTCIIEATMVFAARAARNGICFFRRKEGHSRIWANLTLLDGE